jgi:hypothetical protein
MLKKLLVISLIIVGLGQFTFGQKTVSPAKKKLVTQLVANTTEMFPIQVFDDFLKSAVEKASAEQGKEMLDNLTKSIESSTLSDERKSEVKAKIPAFVERITELSRTLLSKGFDVRSWTAKSLEKNCQQQFTVVQLQKLNKFFGSADGKSSVTAFGRVTASGIRGGEKDSFTVEEAKILEQFPVIVGESVMNKFFDIVVKNVMDDITKSVEIWGGNMLKNLEAEAETGLLKKEINKFIAENQ